MVEVKGLAGLLAHIGKTQAEAKKLDAVVVTKVAVEAKRAVLAAASSDVPARRLGRFNRGRGVTLKATFKLRAGVEPTAILLPVPPGPWYLLEHGGKAHPIGTRTRGQGGKRGSRGGSGFLGNAALGFAAMGPVNHPAFSPQRTWSKGAAVAVAHGARTFRGASRQAYLKLFEG